MVEWSDFLLKEDGGFLFQENEFKIVLEQSAIAPPPTPPKRAAAWFGVPRMRQVLAPQRERIYLKEDYLDKLR